MAIAGAASASITINVDPTNVPDEQPPRVNFGDAPAGFGPDSWQGPSTGKSNWHARYNADGDYLSTLFPADAATMTIDDIQSISYFTKRPSGTPSGRDWWIQIYTRPDGTDDAASWYGYRLINNYNDHTNIGDWTEHTTDSGMTFNRNDGIATPTEKSTELGLSGLKSNYGTELVEMISVQTDSGWDGFDGYIDGLVITLENGEQGIVNFSAVPEPMTLAVWLGLAAVGSCPVVLRRMRS